MKNLIKEEINQIKYLFGYQRGLVISEQSLLTEGNGPTSEDFCKALRTYWEDEWVEGTKCELEILDFSNKKDYSFYVAVEPDGKRYYFYEKVEGNSDNPNFGFQEYDEDELNAYIKSQEESNQSYTETQEEQVDCDAIKFLQERPESAKTFYDKLIKMNEVCGGSCVNLKDNSTPKQIAKQYYDAGTYGMLCGMKSLISPSEDDNEIYVSGDDNLTILNELLVLCKSNWRFEGSPLKITDVKKTTSLTTETAIQKKKEASLILQGLINNAKGLTAGIKKEKWQSSLDELNNTADDTLCSQENLDKVKEQKTAAENDLKSYGYALNDTEKSECQKLIDMLEQFPTYCKT